MTSSTSAVPVFQYEYQRILHREQIRQTHLSLIQNNGVFEKEMSAQSTQIIETKKIKNVLESSPRMQWNERILLKEKIREAQHEIHERVVANNAMIIPRTRALNRKCAYNDITEERFVREDIVGAQIKACRACYPH